MTSKACGLIKKTNKKYQIQGLDKAPKILLFYKFSDGENSSLKRLPHPRKL